MRTLSFLIFASLLVSILSCNNANKTNDESINTQIINNPNSSETAVIDSTNMPVIKFENEVHDFGKVNEGEILTYYFQFKNEGKSDLVISNARATCGCTVPQWPKEPIKPGDKGIIEVSFNTNGKSGINTKLITIFANTIPNETVIKIIADIKKNDI